MNISVKSPIYTLRPVCNLPGKIELPTNMYNLPTINQISKNRSTNILHSIQDKVKKILKENCNEAELEKRWDRVLADLHDLANQLAKIRKSVDGKSVLNGLLTLNGVAISANPRYPPYSLFLLRELFKDFLNFDIKCHTHSSVSVPVVSFPESSSSKDVARVSIVLIWKEGVMDTQLVLNPVKLQPILGEMNILRFLARLGLDIGYDDELVLDAILDQCHRLKYVEAKEKSAIFREMSERLGGDAYFGGQRLNIADVAVWSVLKQIGSTPAGGKLKTWFSSVDRLLPSI